VENNIDEIDDLLNDLMQHQKARKAHKNKNKNDAPAEPVCGAESQEHMMFPEVVYDPDDAKNMPNDDEYEPGMHTKAYERDFDRQTPRNETPGITNGNNPNRIAFDANFPIVTVIELTKNWFNKKPVAVIKWNDMEFRRKMTDFKWLWRMLMLNSSIDRVVPEYPTDIPESLWPEGYLRKRKRELNLFLMQCHSLPWIRRYRVYADIFLEVDKNEWKRKRNAFDQEMIDRIKHKQETYDPKIDNVVEDKDKDKAKEKEKRNILMSPNNSNFDDQNQNDGNDALR